MLTADTRRDDVTDGIKEKELSGSQQPRLQYGDIAATLEITKALTSITQLATITVDRATMFMARRMLSTMYAGPADSFGFPKDHIVREMLRCM